MRTRADSASPEPKSPSGGVAGGLKIDSRRRRELSRAATQSGSKRAVWTALGGNLAIAVTKCLAAWITGSAAMLSEGAHSLVDSGNEVLLLYGMRRAAQPPDLAHPFGHGREAYFWSFMVALMFFLLGAGVSLYEGIEHVLHPHPIHYIAVTYGVIVVSVLCEGYSLRVALKEFSKEKAGQGYLEAIRRSKNPTTFTVLLEDSAAVTGLTIAFLGIFGAQLLGIPELDGVASIGVGLVLTAMALFLAYETKSLLIGEAASPELEAAILRAAFDDPAVEHANGVITVHLGPEQVVAELSLEFKSEARAGEIEESVERIEAAIRAEYREIAALFVKPQSAEEWRRRHRRIEAASDEGLRERSARRRGIRDRVLRQSGRP